MSKKKISGYTIFLDQKLGKGAYGVVYKGQKQTNKNQVAIKVIDKSNIDGDSYLKGALVKQIKVMQTVKSPHIVQLLDVMESGRNYYIIQQLCDIDLQRFLQQSPGHALSEGQSIRLLTEICTGFLALVKQGIVHRDLKPANVFLSEKRAKIGDFGFAKKQETGLKNVTQVGTPLYMAIQLLKGQPYTSKCDIWALGFIFYEMLHGHTPWTARSQFQLINNITTKPLRIDEKFSNKTKDFLKKALGATEDKRLNWQQLYSHQIFNGAFKKEIQNKQTLQNKYKKVMIDIRIQVNSQNVDLLKLWENLGYSHEKDLSEQEFKEFIQCLVPNIEKGQLQYFFNKMDYNHDGSLSLKEIQAQFKQNQIPFKSSQRIPYLIKKIATLTDSINDQQNPIDIQLQNKVRNAFKKMENTLTKKNITLYKVFSAYDSDKTGQLSLSQFYNIMSKLNANITEEQVKLIFGVIDSDKSNTIEFAQLNGYYSRINGIPLSMNMALESVRKSKNS